VAHQVPKVSFEDSPRIDKLMHAGNIYLSLRDAIALALENNLDIEYARFNPKLADANSMRVSAGALLRSVSSSIRAGRPRHLGRGRGRLAGARPALAPAPAAVRAACSAG